jgi:hypothetical protein
MPPSPADIVELTSVHAEFQAEAIAAALRARGIEARVLGGALAGFRAEAPGAAKVVVFRRDLTAARAILAEVRSESVDIDWDEIELGEPEDPQLRSGHQFAPAPSAPPHRRPSAAALRADRRQRFALVAIGMAALLASYALRLPAALVLAAAFMTLFAIGWAAFGFMTQAGRRPDPFDQATW